MTINAQRFKSIGADFNIASTNFNSLKLNEILNAPEKNFKDLLKEGKDLVGQIKGIEQKATSKVKGILTDITRITQGTYDTFVDLAKMPEAYVSGLIDEVFGDMNSSVKNLMKNMTKVCRNKALGSSLGIKGKLPNPKCGGMSIGTPGCSSSNATNLINQATLASLAQTQKLLNNALNQIVALGNIGFGANLCGVFGAITQGLTDSSIIGGAAGLLLNQQGMAGNLQAVFDISKNLNDINIISDFPNTISNIAENVMVPFNNFQNDVFQMSDRITGSFGAINSAWDKAETGIASVANLGLRNDELGNIFSCKASNTSVDVHNLDAVQTTPDAPVLSSYDKTPENTVG